MNKLKEIFLSSLLVVASVLIAFVAAELVYRVVKGLPILSTGNLIQARLDLIRNMTGVMVHDQTVGWRLKDDFFTAGVPFTTGQLGVRMNENKIIPLRTGGVLAVGDSFTAGSGVRDDEAWPAKLESLLNQPVINGSAGAYAVDQIVLRAEQLLPVVKPKTLIIGVLSQDSLRNNFSVYGGGYKPYFEIQQDRLELKNVPVPRVETVPLKLDWAREILGRSYIVDAIIAGLNWQDWWVDNRFRYRQIHGDKVGPDISCKLIDRLLQLGRDHGMRPMIVMMYGAAEIETNPPPWYATTVVDCAKSKGIDLVDSYQPTRAILEKDRPAFVRLWLNEGGQLGHLSPEGNEFIAKLVKAKLEERNN